MKLFCRSLLIFATSLVDAQGAPNATPTPVPPLFAAFKMFCVDTGANIDAIKAAVTAAGGVPHRPPGSTEWPFPMTVANWDIILQGHRMTVGGGTAYPSRALRRVRGPTPFDFGSCIISSSANEDASVGALRAWVGVKPEFVDTSPSTDPWVPGLKQYHYDYVVVGPDHKIAQNARDLLSAESEGRHWGLVVLTDDKSASVQLTHTLPRSP